MPVRGTQGACPATAVSRRPRRQTAAAILVRGAGSMRTNGCRPRANCRCCRHICAGRPAWGGGEEICGSHIFAGQGHLSSL